MKRGFLNELDAKEIGESGGRAVWRLNMPLTFYIDRYRSIQVPKEFETDLASVPRLPLVWMLWGDRAHREAVMHDYCYRTGAAIIYKINHEAQCVFSGGEFRDRSIPRDYADWYFRLAIISETPEVHKKGQPYWIYQPMYLGVRTCGGSSYHRMKVMDKFEVAP
jgi:hypothetical protein